MSSQPRMKTKRLMVPTSTVKVPIEGAPSVRTEAGKPWLPKASTHCGCLPGWKVYWRCSMYIAFPLR